jgi:hypothetical protein
MLIILSSAQEQEAKHDLQLKDAMLQGCIHAFKEMNKERCEE